MYVCSDSEVVVRWEGGEMWERCGRRLFKCEVADWDWDWDWDSLKTSVYLLGMK